MEKFSASVRWQDGTFDFDRECSACDAPVCEHVVHNDFYRETNSPRLVASMTESPSEGNDKDMFLESPFANPDCLEFPGKTDEAEDLAIRQQMNSAAEKAFGLLTAPQQEVWDLCMRQGMSEEAAGEQLGKSQPAVSKLLSRAKAIFTNALREQQ